MHPSPSLYIYNLMQHDIGHVMHDAGSDKCWVALTVGTTCGPGRHKSCQKLCRVRFPQVRPRLTESVGIHWKHLYRALITFTMDPEFGCDSSEGKSWQELERAILHHAALDPAFKAWWWSAIARTSSTHLLHKDTLLP